MNLPADEHGAESKKTEAQEADVAARRSVTRKVLDEVFGDVLPTVTRDELDDSADRSNGGRDQWYRDNRPPHHE